MYDKELACHILDQVLKSAKTIMMPVKSVDDFTNTPAGATIEILELFSYLPV